MARAKSEGYNAGQLNKEASGEDLSIRSACCKNPYEEGTKEGDLWWQGFEEAGGSEYDYFLNPENWYVYEPGAEKRRVRPGESL